MSADNPRSSGLQPPPIAWLTQRAFLCVVAWGAAIAKRRSLAAFAVAALLMPCGVRANPILEWNEVFIRCVQKEMPSPCLAVRNLAMLHLAMHLAVTRSQAAGLRESDIAAAADAAGDEVCRCFFPAQTAEFDALLAGQPKAEDVAAQAAARQDARTLLAAHANDGASTQVAYVPNNKPGQWRRTEPRLRPPEMPHWGMTKPFLMEAGSQFRPEPPPALESPEYAREVEEVRRLGGKSSTERTEEQTLIAKFWSDFSYTSTPPGHWNNIARDVARRRHLSLAETARFFALLNVAMADTGIAVWETKYHFNFWRPITAIRRADEDGNSATAGDPQWLSLLPSPPHPEYVSGHAGFSGAAARILAEQFGSDAVEFEASSDSLPGVVRRFQSFQACAEEIARSRVYGGIHYGVSGSVGLALGHKVAEHTLREFRRIEASGSLPGGLKTNVAPVSPQKP